MEIIFGQYVFHSASYEWYLGTHVSMNSGADATGGEWSSHDWYTP